MKKLSTVALALLAALMVLGFVGCKQEDDTPAGPATVATWENGETGTTMALTAFDDKSWNLVMKSGAQSMEYAKGTYTGDASKDGKIQCKMTHEADEKTNALKELSSPVSFDCTISGKTLKVPATLFGVLEGAPDFEFTRK